MTLDQHEPFASLRDLHMYHYSRPYRIRVTWVGQQHVRRVNLPLVLAMREWQQKDAEVAASVIEARRIGTS